MIECMLSKRAFSSQELLIRHLAVDLQIQPILSILLECHGSWTTIDHIFAHVDRDLTFAVDRPSYVSMWASRLRPEREIHAPTLGILLLEWHDRFRCNTSASLRKTRELLEIDEAIAVDTEGTICRRCPTDGARGG